jgi:Gdp/GTP exchange factor required for growth at low temperatures
LRKIVKDCKKAHMPSFHKTKSKLQASVKPTKITHVLGEKFAEATKPADDSDVDLDFMPDEARSSGTPSGYQSDPVNAHLNTVSVGTGISPMTPISLAALANLQQTPRTADSDMPHVTLPLPTHHNPISRAFVNTIGRLGKWKRVLNARSAGRPPLASCANVSAFDLDLNGIGGDLLGPSGGAEQYLQPEQISPTSSVIESPIVEVSLPNVIPPSEVPSSDLPPDYEKIGAIDRVEPVDDSTSEISTVEAVEQGTAEPSAAVDPIDPTPVGLVAEVEVEASEGASIRSSSTDSLGEPISPKSRAIAILAPPTPSPWQFDIVSIDDLDLSDTSSGDEVVGPAAPPGLRRLPRKLPLRRDFEFVRRSESAASTSLHLHDSLASGRASTVASTSSTGAGLGGTIQQWQMNALVDSLSNDEEKGDVEAALRRLEGQINPKKIQENAFKVDGWVRTIQERMAAGDYTNDMPRSDEDDQVDEQVQESEVGEVEGDREPEHLPEEGGDLSPLSSSLSHVEDVTGVDHIELAKTPLATQTSHSFAPTSLIHRSEPNLVAEDVAPVKILQDILPPRSGETEHKLYSPLPNLGNQEVPRMHRSFILTYRAQTLVEQFSMIDRELFLGVKFEELVLDHWAVSEDVDVLDWTQFLKDRARWKSESRFPHKTSALAAVRARFNLMANFTRSEVVLALPNERALVVGKLIRIAWVSCRKIDGNVSCRTKILATESIFLEQLSHSDGDHSGSAKRIG